MSLEVTQMPLSALREYAGNAKIHDEANVEAIRASIRRFGNCDPIGVWTAPDGTVEIVEGHGRKMALEAEGYEVADVIFLDHLTDEERRAYALAHNQTTMMSDFDLEILESELDALADFGMDDFGFDMGGADDEPAEVVEDEVPEDAPALCKVGDVWQLGRHRLMCGDSTDAEAVARLMDGEKADLLLTDPPYNVSYEGKTKDALTIANDNMADAEFRKFLVSAYLSADSVMKPGAAFYIWHADLEGYNFRGAARDVGWTVRQCLVWCKNTLVLGRQDYQWRHEPCLYGWKDGSSHYWNSDRKQTTVLEFDKPQRNGDHPTMKPVELFAYQMKNSTKPNGLVLDIFGGSGTTLIAAEQLGRTCYMMELDPHYCDVIIERWQNLTGGTAVRCA